MEKKYKVKVGDPFGGYSTVGSYLNHEEAKKLEKEWNVEVDYFTTVMIEPDVREVLTVIRKEYPITVLIFKVSELDKTKCSNKFQKHSLNKDFEIYVRCDKDGEILFRGKKQEYRLYDISKHEKRNIINQPINV